jgi:hypothetical protein
MVGTVFAIGAAAWLLLGFDPFSEKYSRVEGGGYSQSVPVGLMLLVRDQARAAAIAVAGGALQLAGLVLGVFAK